VSGSELLGYGFVFFGISSVYVSLGQEQQISLFLGTIIFLIGILLYVVNNFLIFWNSQLFIPTSLLMIGTSFFMIYFDDIKRKKLLFTAVAFIFLGILTTTIIGNFNFSSFFNSMVDIAGNYWPVLIIAAGILFLVWWEEKGQS
jgi:hypothetical protein